MHGVLLAAGRGERMEPLSSIVAKPALEVLGRPLLASAASNLLRAGVTEIVVNLHRHPEQVVAAARSVAALAAVFSWEPELLGSLGGVAGARRLLEAGDLLVGNADTWADVDLAPVVEARERDAIVLGLLSHPDPQRWSSVVVDGDGTVVRILPPGADGGPDRLLFTGFQLLGRDVVEALLPGRGEMAALWGSALARGRLRGVAVEGRWREAGTPASYLRLVVESLGGGSWVHPSAAVGDRVQLERTAVGAGCRVAGRCSLTGCVLTAGATVGPDAHLVDCVVAGPVAVAGEALRDTLVVPGMHAPLR
ncbi:MAG TPA: sugar phosphate nucleotidyltransferase [Thermoanaerobaculaceae bacterium]|nr:sugar phosphate nucleotidyltransferase [Thermoanaerobaculaceae bacterium]